MVDGQDGITAFEALESGVLPPLRELLAWLEAVAAIIAARRSRLLRPMPLEVKIAAEFEIAAVGAFALAAPKDGGDVDGVPTKRGSTPSSEAVLQVTWGVEGCARWSSAQ